VVELAPLKTFKKTITLAQIKSEMRLQNMGLVKQSRLSVMPVTADEYEYILSLSK